MDNIENNELIQSLKEEEQIIKDRIMEEIGVDLSSFNIYQINLILPYLKEQREKEYYLAKKEMDYYIDEIRKLEKNLEEDDLEEEINKLILDIGDIISPRNSILLLDKPTLSMAAGLIPYNETIPFKMERGRVRKEEQQKTTHLTLNREVLKDILPDNINGEDINLLEAIMTLVDSNELNGRMIFTLNEIYKIEKRNLRARPNQEGQRALEERIIKLISTIITLDPRGENSYYPDFVKRTTTNLLKAEILDIELSNGEITKALKVEEMPLPYNYAATKRQLTKIPLELTENGLVKTKSVLILENYLLRRIAQMRNRRNLTRTILFETLYGNMNYQQSSKSAIKNAKSRTRINTEEILKTLVKKEYIKDYKIVGQGRRIYHKIEIIL